MGSVTVGAKFMVMPDVEVSVAWIAVVVRVFLFLGTLGDLFSNNPPCVVTKCSA